MIFIGDGGYYGDGKILLNGNNLTRFEEGVFKSVMQEKYQFWYQYQYTTKGLSKMAHNRRICPSWRCRAFLCTRD